MIDDKGSPRARSEASTRAPWEERIPQRGKLYGSNGSSNLELPVDIVPIDLMKDRPVINPLNATSKIPVLVDGDFVLWEAGAPT